MDIDKIIRESLNSSQKISEELNNKMINKYSESMKTNRKIPKWTVMVIVPAVIALTGAGIYTAVEGGFFKDKTTISGTVIGQTYENATDEIEVKSEYFDGTLHIILDLLKSDSIPYSVLEEIKPYNFSLTALSDNSIVEDIQFDYVIINENIAEIIVDFNYRADEEYKLTISSFLGSKKADQPLEIKGNWETVFGT